MKRQLQKIATSMGYKGMKSMSDMYRGGTMNAFSHPTTSATTLTVQLTQNNKVCGIEVNTKYFTVTEQVKKFNAKVSYENPMSIEDAIVFARECN